jgi:hypothetical protein
LGAWHEREHQWINTAILPKEPGLRHHYTAGDRYDDEAIEQPTQKTAWMQNTQSGILQVSRRCTSNLNPQEKTSQKRINISSIKQHAIPWL